MVGSLEVLYIPPPQLAELPSKITLVRVGLLCVLSIPPPHAQCAELPLKVTFVKVGSLVALYIPPP